MSKPHQCFYKVEQNAAWKHAQVGTLRTSDAVDSSVSMRAATISCTLVGVVDSSPSLPVDLRAARDCNGFVPHRNGGKKFGREPKQIFQSLPLAGERLQEQSLQRANEERFSTAILRSWSDRGANRGSDASGVQRKLPEQHQCVGIKLMFLCAVHDQPPCS